MWTVVDARSSGGDRLLPGSHRAKRDRRRFEDRVRGSHEAARGRGREEDGIVGGDRAIAGHGPRRSEHEILRLTGRDEEGSLAYLSIDTNPAKRYVVDCVLVADPALTARYGPIAVSFGDSITPPTKDLVDVVRVGAELDGAPARRATYLLWVGADRKEPLATLEARRGLATLVGCTIFPSKR
ncbi:MAG: hypothetical protein KF819_10640 [Labilithrix sp.]|nr:hypothetical protein [Labilithrix sp.]